jgi:hypothetical protein
LPTQSDVSQLLAQGIAAAQAGQHAQAYNLLLDVVERDQYNELAWLWLSTVADDLNDQRICLENVLTINSNNTLARDWLAKLPSDGAQSGSQSDQHGSPPAFAIQSTDQPAQQSSSATASTPAISCPPAPVTLWPVVAFWASASLFFVGGGVASLFQFLGILMRARGLVQNLSFTQMAWLPMGFFFIIFGLTGFSLAWQLAHRQPGGYYGSLIFGLVLILLGPGAGLILDPPNYLAIACTSLTPTAVVLLTLASMAGFESKVDSHERSVA